MTELKTLKDIDVCCVKELKLDDCGCNYGKNNIRAEAVKWIKHYLNLDRIWINKNSYETLDGLVHSRIEFIKMFFNLTEEDLI